MLESEIVQDLVTRNTCRVCNKKDLEPIVSLGQQYLINFLETPNQRILKAPLDLVLCNKKEGGCGLIQLKHTVPGDLLYRKFWYKSGVNQSMKDALADISKNAQKFVLLNEGDIVVDIGANDGTLLRSYGSKNLSLIGFEPATNLIEDAKVGTTLIINDFFNYNAFKKEFPNKKAKIVTSIAMFYDLENPKSFVNDVKKILDDNGIWIIQMNYLMSMLELNAFDNIVHEHLEYYSLSSLENLLKMYNLEVFEIEINEINGGSIRTYIKHKDCKKFSKSKKISEILDKERKMGLDEIEPYHQFAERIKELKKKTYDFIKDEVSKGKTIYIYGASTRGNTLLQFYNLDHRLIKAAADRNPMKWGKEIVGAGIPIISEEQARKEKPDYFLVLPWYFIDEFKKRESDYLKNGGKFIVPLPEFQII